jgi:transcriptional regulator with XRE-family HTH domain
MDQKNGNFSTNLRHICAERISVAQICREIGINPQQFNRYLSGAGMPSAHNLRRICLYFELSEQDILSSSDHFVALRGRLNKNNPTVYKDPFANAFPGDLYRLRQFVGVYHIHFLSPAWPGSINIGVTFLDERDGQVNVRSVERGLGPERETLQRSRSDGRASYHGSRIFLVEFERDHEGSISETILYPAHRQQRTYLRGMTIGIAWRPRRMPYSSRVIWKRADNNLSAKDLLRRCGVYPIDHKVIDPTVRNFLLEKSGLFGEE